MKLNELLKTLKKDEVMQKIKENQIYEFGTLCENLAEKIEAFLDTYIQEDGTVRVAGALNNNDYSHMLLEILHKNTEKVLIGLGIISWLLNADETIVYIPEEDTEFSKELCLCAGKLGMEIQIKEGLVDTRCMRNGMVNHFETLAAVADVITGHYEASSLVSVEKYSGNQKCEVMSAPYHVSFGTKISEIIGELDGVKAIQIGGGLYRTNEISDMILTKNLALGDGVIKLYTDECCLLAAALEQLLVSRKKSCGKCTFCREGLIQLYTRMKEIVSGKGEALSVDIMDEIGKAMAFSSSCTIGNFGSAFVLNTIEKFANEYQDHIKKKKCTAGSCRAFMNTYIDPLKCTGCGECLNICDENCIEGFTGYIHMIEDMDCSRCGKCMSVCPEEAIISTVGRVPRLPDRLTRVGRFKRY